MNERSDEDQFDRLLDPTMVRLTGRSVWFNDAAAIVDHLQRHGIVAEIQRYDREQEPEGPVERFIARFSTDVQLVYEGVANPLEHFNVYVHAENLDRAAEVCETGFRSLPFNRTGISAIQSEAFSEAGPYGGFVALKLTGAIDDRQDAHAAFEAERCSAPRSWRNGPGESYGWHAHDYHKVLFCLEGSIVFHLREADVRLGVGDRLDLAPGTEHAATVGPSGVECVEASR
jgi:hypothetical protein